jgi:hypothetical protein
MERALTQFVDKCSNGVQANEVEDFITAMQVIHDQDLTLLLRDAWTAASRSAVTLVPVMDDDELPWIRF